MISVGHFKTLLASLILGVLIVFATAGVAHAAPPSNDNFADAQEVSGPMPVLGNGTNVEATSEPGEPDHAEDEEDSHSVWYEWTPTTTGPVTVDAGTSNYVAFVSVYTGTEVDNLTRVATEPFFFAKKASFNAVSGTTYRIAIDAISASPERSPSASAPRA